VTREDIIAGLRDSADRLATVVSQTNKYWSAPAIERMRAAADLLAGEVIPDCPCRACIVARGDKVGNQPREACTMILCRTCGNKRCPHATDHRHACTGSNAVGQPGSIYAAPPPTVTLSRADAERLLRLVVDPEALPDEFVPCGSILTAALEAK
jgi:hypothetical protein